MKKLRLEIEQLQVESFTAGANKGARGTVAAHDGPTQPSQTQPVPVTNSCPDVCGDSVVVCQVSKYAYCFTLYGDSCKT
jgi:hypothetical protein